jgi:teichuronic acid exporter
MKTALNARSLDRSLLLGVVWTASAKWTAQVVSWGALFVLARLLSPADYGLVGMSATFFSLITMLAEFGIGSAIVALRNVTEEQIAQTNTAAVLLGAGGAIVAALCAPLVAAFFRAPELKAIVIVMSLTFVVSGFKTVPVSLLQRDLGFRFLGMAEGVQAIAQSIATIIMALLGLGYWSLIFGGMLGTAIGTGIPALHRRASFAVPRWSDLKPVFVFGWELIVGRTTWFLYSNADVTIIGRKLGQTSLGAYTMAFNIASLPLQKITGMVFQVTPAIFSAVQTDPAQLRRYLLRITQGLAVVTLPLAIGISVIAAEFVPLALGPKWVDSIRPLQILACMGAMRSLATVLPQILMVMGENRFAMWNSVLTLTLLAPSFYIASAWGITSVAAVWLIVYPLICAPLYWKAFRVLDLHWTAYLNAIRAPLIAALAMGGVVTLINQLMPHEWPLLMRVAIKVGIGAIVYAGAMWGQYGSIDLAGWKSLFASPAAADLAAAKSSEES